MLSQNVLVGICVTVCFGGPYKTHNGQQHNGPNLTAQHRTSAPFCVLYGPVVSVCRICLYVLVNTTERLRERTE